MKISINAPVFFTACVLIFNTCLSQSKSNNCIETKFKSSRNGNIETLRIKKIDTNNRLISETDVLTSKFIDSYNKEIFYEYDEKGNKTKQTSVEDGKTKKIIQYSYDKNNQLIEEKEIKSNFKNNITESDLPTVIKKISGNKIEQQLYLNGKSIGKIKIILNHFGNILNKEIVDINGNITLIETNEYSSNGNLLKQEINDKIAKTITIFFSNYENNLLQTERKIQNDELLSEIHYMYDLKGRITQKKSINSLGKEDYTLLNEYNDGLLVKSNYFRDGTLASKFIYEYDSNLNKIKEIYFEGISNQPLIVKEWYFECK